MCSPSLMVIHQYWFSFCSVNVPRYAYIYIHSFIFLEEPLFPHLSMADFIWQWSFHHRWHFLRETFPQLFLTPFHSHSITALFLLQSYYHLKLSSLLIDSHDCELFTSLQYMFPEDKNFYIMGSSKYLLMDVWISVDLASEKGDQDDS